MECEDIAKMDNLNINNANNNIESQETTPNYEIKSEDEETNNCNIGAKIKERSASVSKAPEMYYGVYSYEMNENFYTDRAEVLQIVKANKRARFKSFTNANEAIHFSQYGCESKKSDISPTTIADYKCYFKTPKSQELVAFRKAIEAKDNELLMSLIVGNPRYLISSGDTPSILQEGCRYNALHIAAKADNDFACRFILEQVSSIDFMEKLYGTRLGMEERCTMLLDLYLNTPSKGANETPLHMAAKFGSMSVVKILVLYDLCDKNRTNRYGESPLDVAGKKFQSETEIAKFRNEVIAAFKNTFYIPVFRSEDSTIQPMVGEPFSPKSPEAITLPALPPVCEDVTSPPLKVKAFAGPMSMEDAGCFRKKWRSLELFKSSALKDADKGLESVGRHLAAEFNVNWKEYWDFLGSFTNLKSAEGLKQLDNYLKIKFEQIMQTKMAHEVITPPKTNYETYITAPNLPLALEISPMSELCQDFQSKLNLRSLPVQTQPTDCPTSSSNAIKYSVQLFASHMVNAIDTRNQKAFVDEISLLQNSLTNCSVDTKFQSIDFTKIHSRLAMMIYSKLQTTSIRTANDFLSSLKKNCEDIALNVNGVIKGKYPYTETVIATRCVISCFESINVEQISSLSECVFDANLPHCQCVLDTKTANYHLRSIAHKRLVFKDDESDRDLKAVELEAPLKHPIDMAGGDSPENDSLEYEFFATPPSSPSSESDEELFEFADAEQIELYLKGLPSPLQGSKGMNSYRRTDKLFHIFSPTHKIISVDDTG